MGRREREGEASDRLRGKPGRGLVRDVGGMVVEDDLDGGVGGVGGVEELEKLNEFAATVAFLDQGVDVTGETDRSPPSGSECRAACIRDRASRSGLCREGVGDPAPS